MSPIPVPSSDAMLKIGLAAMTLLPQKEITTPALFSHLGVQALGKVIGQNPQPRGSGDLPMRAMARLNLPGCV